VETFLARDRRTREVRVFAHVGNPGRLPAGPHTSGQSYPRLECALPRLRLKRRNDCGGVRPKAVAPQEAVLATHKPQRAHLPSETFARRLQDLGNRFLKIRGVRQHSRHGVLRCKPPLNPLVERIHRKTSRLRALALAATRRGDIPFSGKSKVTLLQLILLEEFRW